MGCTRSFWTVKGGTAINIQHPLFPDQLHRHRLIYLARYGSLEDRKQTVLVPECGLSGRLCPQPKDHLVANLVVLGKITLNLIRPEPTESTKNKSFLSHKGQYTSPHNSEFPLKILFDLS
jgi:hypothetical protein